MERRQVGALLLAWLTACAGVPRVSPGSVDPHEAELAAARYELRVLTSGSGHSEPVEVARADFERGMRVLARELRPSEQLADTARWLMAGGLQADLLAEVERGRVVRLTPLEEGSPLEASSAAEVKRRYLRMCQEEYGGGDCLELLTDGPNLTREDLRTLGLALSLKGVLQQTRVSLKEMVSPRALVAMVVWACCFYLLLWLLPEPISKGVAASLTVALLAWLPVHTVWSLMEGWAGLVHAVDRATSYEQIEEAGQRFSQVMGENTARVLVMLVTAALAGGAARFSSKLPELPGFARAAARAEAQGVSLAEAGEVEVAAAADESTFTLMVRRPGGRAAAAAEDAAEARAGSTIIIRHQGGNRQVSIGGQRWHVPAGRSVKEIPSKDPVGDQLQVAARRLAQAWSRSRLSREQFQAIERARAQGQYLRAHLLERMYRGQWVEERLRGEFMNLQWNKIGVDAVDPATGLEYEVLTGTDWNMQLHGRRMAEQFFRLITF